MSNILTPVWTDNVTVLAPYAVIKGESHRIVTGLDLRAKFGAMLKIALACGGSTAITSGGGLYAKLYRTLNNDGVNPMNAALYFSGVQTAVGKALINNASNYAAGIGSIAYDGAAGTAFAAENQLCLTGVVSIPVASGLIVPSENGGTEWLNLSKGATTPCLFNTPTKYLHLDNEFITLGSAWDVWLQGGAAYALVFDHLFDAAGEAMICAAYLQTYDSNLIT
jgi:hypothetical protein